MQPPWLTEQAISERHMFQPPSSSQRFRPRDRLRCKDDFTRAFRSGRRAADEHLVVHVSPNSLEWSRLGISVGRRVGNAVMRHRISRRLREAFRRRRGEFPLGVDIVCVAKAGAVCGFQTLSESLVRLAVRAAKCLPSPPRPGKSQAARRRGRPPARRKRGDAPPPAGRSGPARRG